ncbi:MAG: gamma-glutamyltransferase [Bacteroidota bacterium]
MKGKSLRADDKKAEDDDAEWRAPRRGEIFTNHALASVFEEVASNGRKGFYEGWVGERIVEAVREEGGVMTQQDLKEHRSTFEDPICVEYQGSFTETWQYKKPFSFVKKPITDY